MQAPRADIIGLPAENKIDNIHIFVFDQSGSLPTDPTKGKFGPWDLEDTNRFTRNGDTYEMVNNITTTAGTKTIYVVANLNENGIPEIGTEAQLLERAVNVHREATGGGLIRYDTQDPPEVEGIVFAGSAQTVLNSIASGVENAAVTVAIERAVSRLITTSQAEFELRWASTTTEDMTIHVSQYLVTQDAYRGTVGQSYFDANKTQKRPSSRN